MNASMRARARIRVDLQLIADLVAPNTRVLDVGCGDGTLLGHLYETKQVDGRGIELSMAGVRAAVSQGLSVIQGDADTDLDDFPSDSFDYVILSQTLQATRSPLHVLQNLMRIGERCIVSFPNFGYWENRLQLVFRGRMPVTEGLTYQWYETPNIHLCTIRDFLRLCDENGYVVERGFTLDAKGRLQTFSASGRRANLLGAQAVYLLGRD